LLFYLFLKMGREWGKKIERGGHSRFAAQKLGSPNLAFGGPGYVFARRKEKTPDLAAVRRFFKA